MKKIIKHKALRFLLVFFLILASSFIFSIKETSAISVFRPFGGRILAITPNANPACPAGTHIVTVATPAPIIAIFTNVPAVVRNGPARTGAWTLGFATPPVPPCLPIVAPLMMGVGKIGPLPF
jgi:hypothetical protein